MPLTRGHRRYHFRDPPRHRRLIAALAAVSVLIAAGFAIGLVWFVKTLPSTDSRPDRATDAVVVLTGGGDRVKAGIALLQGGHVRPHGRLLISGVHRDVGIEDVKRLVSGPEQDWTPDLAARISLGYSAANTRGNAAEARQWVSRHGFDSVRLVTAAYHMPRSLVEFRNAMPDIAIIPHPVRPDAFPMEGWWHDPGALLRLGREFAKYLLAQIRTAVPG